MRLVTMNQRMAGKTHAICMAAKAIDATVICVDEKHAARIRKEYGVKAISMHVQERARAGSGGSFIWDHFAADMAWDELSAKLEAIRKKHRNLKDRNTRLSKENARLKEEIDGQES